MPTSQHRQISPILDLITHLHPRSVLDVGIGVGTYGFLCAMIADQHRLLPGYEASPEFRLDGIEGFSDYVGPIQRAVYNRIMVGNLLQILPDLPPKSYDLLLMIDVLEHVEPRHIDFVLEHCHGAAHAVLISTPHRFAAQGHLLGNDLEEHRSWPTREQLSRRGFRLYIPDDTSLIAFHSDDGAFERYYRKRLARARVRAVLPAGVRAHLGRLRRFSQRDPTLKGGPPAFASERDGT